MKRIALVWELGFGASYLAFIRQLYQAATQSGLEACVICKDVALAQQLLEPSTLIVPAPLAETMSTAPVSLQTSYASLLLNNGFDDADRLAGRVQAWRQIFQQYQIELVIARHSPTALLAARLDDRKIIHYGNHFSIPTCRTPWPSFRPDLRVDELTLRRNEMHLTGIVNRALQGLNAPPLRHAADIFADLDRVMLDYSELDVFAAERRPDRLHYLGFPDANWGADGRWPDLDDRKIFASLLPDSDPAWLPLLQRSGAAILCRIRSGPGVQAWAASQTPRIKLHLQGSLNFQSCIARSDVVFGYGSHNLVCEALLAGRPLVVVAHSADELLLGHRVEALGAGIVLPRSPTPSAAQRLERMVSNQRLRAAAGRLQQAWQAWPRTQIAGRIISLSEHTQARPLIALS